MVICARRTVLLPRSIIRLVVIESVMTLSLVRDTETNEADEIDRSIDRSIEQSVALCSE